MESEEPNLCNPSPLPRPLPKNSTVLLQERHNAVTACRSGNARSPKLPLRNIVLPNLAQTIYNFVLVLFGSFLLRYRLQCVALLHLIGCQVNISYVCLFFDPLTTNGQPFGVKFRLNPYQRGVFARGNEPIWVKSKIKLSFTPNYENL